MTGRRKISRWIHVPWFMVSLSLFVTALAVLSRDDPFYRYPWAAVGVIGFVSWMVAVIQDRLR